MTKAEKAEVNESSGKVKNRQLLHSLIGNRTTNRNKRLGRGRSSGHGKTSTRGGKGQGARSGFRTRPHYIGGAQPLYRTHPIKGFTRGAVKKETYAVNLNWINEHFEDGELCNLKTLHAKGHLPKRLPRYLKILAKGSHTFVKKVAIEAHCFSNSALNRLKEVKAEYRLLNK